MPKQGTLLILALFAAFIVPTQLSLLGTETVIKPGSLSNEEVSQVVARGQDYALIQKIRMATGPEGSMVSTTNQFTLLENCMHYLDAGEWKQSEDLIEGFEGGAIAQYGPNRAVFSSELNTDVVFDVLASDGKRIRGGIRAVQLVNSTESGLLTPDHLARLIRRVFQSPASHQHGSSSRERMCPSLGLRRARQIVWVPSPDAPMR